MNCCVGGYASELTEARTEGQRQELLHELAREARPLADGSLHVNLSAPAIHCGACIGTIERELLEIEGVRQARANLSLRRIGLTFDPESKALEQSIDALERIGYRPQLLEETALTAKDDELRSLVRSVAVAGFAAANIMLLSVSVWTGAEGATRDLFHAISALIAIPAVAFAGRPFFRSAAQALRSRRINMDVPISLGVLLATGMSIYESFFGHGHAYFDAAVSLLFFLLIGRTLDHMMRARAREAVGRIGRLAAKGGQVIEPSGALKYMPLADIRPGMLLRVSAGERVPADATVISGESDLDRSLVTGESAPVHAAPGMTVEAGILNLTGVLDVRAEKRASESFLAEIMNMMAAAERGRGRYVQIADRMAKIYSPAVHILAAASFIGWMLLTGGDWHTALTIAVSVLIITCPCALGLAVPVAHVISASRLLARGILIKDGSALERLAEADHAVFDKTGTLTTGHPDVAASTIPPGHEQAVAKAMALRSIHPAARALARAIAAPPSDELIQIREYPGLGVQAEIAGRTSRLGRREWVAEIAAGGSEALAGGLAFAISGGGLRLVRLQERLREGALAAVHTLGRAGIECEVLSGDSTGAVEAVAAVAGIRHWQAGLKPGDKLHILEARAGLNERVLMVGDGLNDAPALAAAHVSMAPGEASDAGRLAADFVFTGQDFSAIAIAHAVAKRTRRIVAQNFGLAIFYNLFAVPMAMAGYLNPLIAAIAMSSSSIIVVANSLRLQRLPGVAHEQSHDPHSSGLGSWRPWPRRLPVVAQERPV